LADLDQDGDLDIIYVRVGDEGIKVLYNLGSNNFSETEVFHLGNVSKPVLVRDFNNDGCEDVVFGSTGTIGRSWAAGDCEGGFGSINSMSENLTQTLDLVSADLNNDGHIDVISSLYFNSHTLVIYINEGTGSFTEYNWDTGTDRVEKLFSENLNDDGFVDIIASVKEYAYNSIEDDFDVLEQVVWYKNDGQGGFGNKNLLTENVDFVRKIRTLDFDNDGDVDIVYVSSHNNLLAWHENLGNDTFSQQIVLD